MRFLHAQVHTRVPGAQVLPTCVLPVFIACAAVPYSWVPHIRLRYLWNLYSLCILCLYIPFLHSLKGSAPGER